LIIFIETLNAIQHANKENFKKKVENIKTSGFSVSLVFNYVDATQMIAFQFFLKLLLLLFDDI